MYPDLCTEYLMFPPVEPRVYPSYENTRPANLFANTPPPIHACTYPLPPLELAPPLPSFLKVPYTSYLYCKSC